MKNKLLPQKMHATLAALLCMMALMPMTAKAQGNVINTVVFNEVLTKSSTVYVGEVVVDGVSEIKYLYSGDITLSSSLLQNLLDGLNGMADGDYAPLLAAYESYGYIVLPEQRLALCSNPDLIADMDANWSSAGYVGTLYYADKSVVSDINSNLYDLDAGFKAVLDAKNAERMEPFDNPIDAPKGFVTHLGSTAIDNVYYTVENNIVIKHVEAVINYNSEVTTVIYTKVELSNSSINISLADNGDNSSVLAANNGVTATVTLADRTFYKDGSWNTLCLPFSLSDFAGTPLEDATVKQLDASSYDASAKTLTLNFESVSEIEAGKPYIVKWNCGENVTNPVFNNVELLDGEPSPGTSNCIDFIGTFSPVTLAAGDRTVLYLGGDSKLYYPSADVPVNAFRGYFQLKNGLIAGDLPSNGAKNFVLNFGGGETTGIAPLWSPEGDKSEASPRGGMEGAFFSLDGRKLQGKPTAKGVYIVNGKKVVK